MPYTRPLPRPFQAVGRLLRGYGVTASGLSGKTGWSYKKCKARLEKPEEIGLEEFRTIARKYHITNDDIIKALFDDKLLTKKEYEK